MLMLRAVKRHARRRFLQPLLLSIITPFTMIILFPAAADYFATPSRR